MKFYHEEHRYVDYSLMQDLADYHPATGPEFSPGPGFIDVFGVTHCLSVYILSMVGFYSATSELNHFHGLQSLKYTTVLFTEEVCQSII